MLVEEGDEEVMALLDSYNVSGRVFVFGHGEEEEEEKAAEEKEEGGEERAGVDSPLLKTEDEEERERLVLLAAEGMEGLVDAIAKLKPVGLLLIQSEEARQRRRRAAAAAEGGGTGHNPKKRRKQKRREEEEEEEEGKDVDWAFLSSLPSGLPVRYISEDVARDLRLALRQNKEDGERLRVWLACGAEIDRNKLHEGAEEEEEEVGEEEREGYRSVTYEGVVYRTLDRAVVDVTKTGCQNTPLPLPE
eukprot:evm.model.NODE_37843_length_25257_cov_25.510313.1